MHIAAVYRGDLALSDDADDADFEKTALDNYIFFADRRFYTCIRVFHDISAQKRKIGPPDIIENIGCAPIKLMIADRHGIKADFIHRLGHDATAIVVCIVRTLIHVT